ncbi:hypothetical protein WN55_11220 [Dufourea novaeangliae]|uniref:Uncharacterized protein n=1 Tax=Dufourea novaeangliae TaxID=178035 RepID=A0A154P9M5_DUFNO|nr:hypothetical protein WN55_11220 [Dufourea novaeangliae]
MAREEKQRKLEESPEKSRRREKAARASRESVMSRQTSQPVSQPRRGVEGIYGATVSKRRGNAAGKKKGPGPRSYEAWQHPIEADKDGLKLAPCRLSDEELAGRSAGWSTSQPARTPERESKTERAATAATRALSVGLKPNTPALCLSPSASSAVLLASTLSLFFGRVLSYSRFVLLIALSVARASLSRGGMEIEREKSSGDGEQWNKGEGEGSSTETDEGNKRERELHLKSTIEIQDPYAKSLARTPARDGKRRVEERRERLGGCWVGEKGARATKKRKGPREKERMRQTR